MSDIRQQLEASLKLTRSCSGCPWWRKDGGWHDPRTKQMRCTSIYVPDPGRPGAAMVNPLFGRATGIENCTHWMERP